MAQPRNQNVSEDESSEDEFVSAVASDDDVSEHKQVLTMHDKDSDEEDLEQLVFGNRSTFRDNLFFHGDGFYGQDALKRQESLSRDEETEGLGLEGVEDADLFMIDAGPAAQKLTTSTAAGPKKGDPDAPVWEDSDDERLTISLADNTRLRKLRLTEAEDLITGTEYTRRLRQQYLRLNAAPAWAKEADGRPSKRRRRRSEDASSNSNSDSDSEGGSGSDDNDDNDNDIAAQPLEKFLRDINSLKGTAGHKRRLRPEVIDIQRLREIPDKHHAAVECLSFHPSYPVLLSASTASVLMLHHIAPDAQPTPNPQLTSVQLKGVDIRRAAFLYPTGDKIFMAGRRKYLHGWDLKSGVVRKTTQVLGHRLEHKTMERFRTSPCGRYLAVVGSSRKGGGLINVLSVTSMQWVAAARMDGRHGIADFAWWSNGEGMTILGRDGQVGEYSVQRKGFLGIWRDDGCIGGIVVALGGHQGPEWLGEDRWVAVGSSSGITNIYERSSLLKNDNNGDGDGSGLSFTIKETPAPTRSFEQLVTPVTVLAFSPDGQLLAFGSREKKDALRLAHLPSCTVYRNWPTTETPLGRISSVAFGGGSNVLAVGNDAGKIRLWEIRK